MIKTTQQFNAVIKKLQGIILKEDKLDEAQKLFLDLYVVTHPGKITGAESQTFDDILWENADAEEFRRIPGRSICSVAWHLWHTARIEDIVTSYLITNDKQIFDTKGFRSKLGVTFHHTGNGMDRPMMERFNADINLKALRAYREEIAKRGFALLKKISSDTLRTKVDQDAIRHIGADGNLDEESLWLMDFWGRKRVAGLVTLPLTRHHLMHHNSSRKILKV